MEVTILHDTPVSWAVDPGDAASVVAAVLLAGLPRHAAADLSHVVATSVKAGVAAVACKQHHMPLGCIWFLILKEKTQAYIISNNSYDTL